MFRSLATKSYSSFKATPTRSFHSPFAVLGSQMTSTPPPSSNPGWYEKQSDFSHEPFPSQSGQNMYVVSEPDPADTHYQVPSGAYPTSAPYISYSPAEAPPSKGVQFSSTRNGFAHPVTKAALAARFSTVPGQMNEGTAHELATQPDSKAAKRK